MLANIALLK